MIPRPTEPSQNSRRRVMMATVQMAMAISSRVAAAVSQWWRFSCRRLVASRRSRSASSSLAWVWISF